MAYRRRYRRKRSIAGEILSDTSYIANRLSWKGAAAFGVVLFVIFYWLMPAWINHQIETAHSANSRMMLEALFARRIHWFQWVGIALGLIGGFFAVRNYFATRPLNRYDENNVSFISRLLARWLD